MALPGVAPVSGRSGADVGATLADMTVPVVAPTPSVVAEQSQAQPNAATVVLEGAVQSVPPGAQVDPPMTHEAAQVVRVRLEGPRARRWCRIGSGGSRPQPLCREEAAPP